MSTQEKILVTSALPYANGPLHIGHLAGAYLPADIFVRYKRLLGCDIVFMCGSDEHGVAITIKAEQEGKTPQAVIDRYHELNKRSFERFGIIFDNYSRTSLPIHHDTAQEFFLDFYNKGILRKKVEKQFFDEQAKMFLPDRYVEGTCPKCGFEDARGDQCENCGSDLNQTELINPRSKITGRTPVLRDTFHWYFPFGDFQDKLKAYVDSHPEWKENVKNYCYGWFKQGLADRAVTRDLNWGIKVPLEEAGDKVLYVWFEAVLGYISATKEWAQKIGSPERWRDYWQDKECRLINFVGKDNIVFHAIMFPAFLMAKGEYAIPSNVPANEFLNIEARKISTSRNFAVWVDEYLDELPPDPMRYCLAAIAPETRDSDFSWSDFQTRNNSELVGILGNFINRSLTFIQKHFDRRVPEAGGFDEMDLWLLHRLAETPGRIGGALDAYQVRRALKELMDLCRDANKYFNDQQPWVTIRSDKLRCATTLNVCAQVVRALAILMVPFMPFSAKRLWQMLKLSGDVDEQRWLDAGEVKMSAGHQIDKPTILFAKIEDNEIHTQLKKLTGDAVIEEGENLISIDDFRAVDLRVARVVSAEKIKKADKLLRLEVEVAGDKRQIVAGIAQHVDPADLPGKQVVVVANLQPAKIRGFESQGMLLAAESDDGKLSLVTVEGEIATGAKVR